MTLDELQNLNSEVQSNLSKNYVEVWLAYNRRFYEATRKAREIILADGGATSLHFEFTEWSHKIRIFKEKIKLIRVVFSHSTHVVDLAFHLCGFPKDW